MSEWNKTQEHFLQELGEKAKSWDWLHQNTSIKYTSLNKWVGLINILFNSIVTGLTASDLWGNPVLFNFIVLIFSILATTMSGVVKTMDYKERIENHRLAGQKFKIYANEIQTLLALKRSDRGDASILVKDYVQRFNTLLIDCPNVDEQIIIRFNKAFGKTNTFSKPEIVDDIKPIEIRDDSTHNEPNFIIDTSIQDEFDKALQNV